MHISINGKDVELEKPMTVAELLKERKIRPEVVAVELNDVMIDREDYAGTALKENDRLEFVYYMGGGGFRTARRICGEFIALNCWNLPG